MRTKNNNRPPLLMTTHGQAFEEQSFYSLKENRHHTTCHPILSGKRVLGSGYGWLVLVDHRAAVDDDVGADCCLWNPQTREKIQLPLLHESHQYNICVLSKPPNEPDCLIVFNYCAQWAQSVCMIGDEKFVKVARDTKHGLLTGISSFGGEIYGIVVRGADCEFVTIRLVVEETKRTVEFKSLLINGKEYWGYPQLWRAWVTCVDNYLIESPCGSPGEFLLVSILYSGVVEFRVFRVNLNEMKCSAELDDIDGMTIFIGYCGNGFCCISETAGSKSNSVYYREEKGSVVRVFGLDDRSSTKLMPCPDAHPYESVNYWVDPSVQQNAF